MGFTNGIWTPDGPAQTGGIDPALLQAAQSAMAAPPAAPPIDALAQQAGAAMGMPFGPPPPSAPPSFGTVPPEALTAEANGYSPGAPQVPNIPMTPGAVFNEIAPPMRPFYADGRNLGDAPRMKPVGLVHDQSQEAEFARRAAAAEAAKPAPPPGATDPLAALEAMATRPAAGGPPGGGQLSALRGKLAADQKATLGTYDAQAAARAAAASLESQKLDEQAHFQTATALRQEADAQIAHGEQQRVLAQHDAYLQKTAQLVDDIAAQKIDPNQIFTGNKAQDFSFALGAMLTAAVIGPDGQSVGAKMVLQTIDRNLRAQQANIENARNAVAARNSVYGQMRQTFQDKQLADENYRVAGLAAAENRLKGMIAGYDSKTAITRGQEVLAEISREKDLRQEAISQQALTVAQQQAAAWASAQRTAADKAFERAVTVYKLKQEDTKLANEGGKSNATAAQKANELFVPTGPEGQGYTARSEIEARDQRTGRASGQELLSLIDQVLAQRKDSSWAERAVPGLTKAATGASYEPDSVGRLKSLSGQIAAAYKDYKKLGTWDNGSEKLITSITGDASAPFGNSEVQLEELRANILGGLARSALSQGQTQSGKAAGMTPGASATPAGFVERK
jgi:hypothetical protein